MAVQKLYPVAPDITLLNWSVNSGATSRYDTINEGTTTPDTADYVQRNIAGNSFFEDVYESGTQYDNIKAYHEKVRINLGEMAVRPESGGIQLNVYAAKSPATFGTPSDWGIGSFYSEGDFLLNYWNLDSGAGGIATDSVTPGRSLSSAFSPTPPTHSTGKISNAADFAGNSYYYSSISNNDNPTYRFDSDKSFGGWIKINSYTNSLIFAIGDGSLCHTASWLRMVDDGRLQFAINRSFVSPDTNLLTGENVQTVYSDVIPLDTWVFVVCVFDINTLKIKISVNAEAFTEAYYTNYAIGHVFYDMYLGGNPEVVSSNSTMAVSESFFDGSIDEWAIWTRALTLDDITDIYASGSGTTFPLPDIVNKRYTTLYDNNGVEIASISPLNISSSGDLIPINSETPALYSFQLDDISQQQPYWYEYDLSNTYIDLQLFSETRYDDIEFVGEGYNTASTVTSASPGTEAWSDLNNTTLLDGSYCSVSAVSAESETLYLSNFGFSLDADQQVIEVYLQISASYFQEPGGADMQATVSYWLTDSSGTKISDEQTFTPQEDSIRTDIFRSTSTLWGATLTPAIVNSSGFGVKIQAVTDGSKPWSMNIDYVGLLVRYSRFIAGVTSLDASIFALDVDVEGQAIASNSTTLFLQNNYYPADTTLHAYAEMPTDTIPLNTIGHEFISPTGVTLHTVGGIYDASTIDLFLQNSIVQKTTPLFTGGHVTVDNNKTLFTHGSASDSGNHTLFVHGVFQDDNNMPLYINGFGDDATSGHDLFIWGATEAAHRKVTTLFMKADNSGELDAEMPLFVGSPSDSDITSNMPLYIKNVAESLSDSTTLYIQNAFVQATDDKTLFISAPGTTAGAYPSDNNMPLYIERDQQYNWRGMSMYMMVASGDSDNTTLFINSVPSETKSTTLFVPASTVDDSGNITLYTHGF